MINIKKLNDNYEFYFDGISIINTPNPTLTYKNLFLNSEIYVDQFKIKQEDIIYIDELTKMCDFIDLSKKSFLFEIINQKMSSIQIVNYENLDSLVQDINRNLGIELLDSCMGDVGKLIQLLLELHSEQYLNKESLKLILNQVFKTKKLIIFNNLSWIKIQDLYEFLNEHYFIILTNDPRKYLTKFEMLNIITNHNLERNELTSIYDIDKFCAYVEKQLSEPFNQQFFYDFINNLNSLKSLRILNLINNL